MIDCANGVDFHTLHLPVLVFSDLDGTLLDHDTYEFDQALPALDLLQSLNIPLVPTTSKTVAEMLPFNQKLNNPHPFIAENGCIIGLPETYFQQPDAPHIEGHTPKTYTLITLARLYADVLEILQSLRNQYDFKFLGFNDLTAAEIAELTQLSLPKAQLAKQRLCSEPLLWQGDESSWRAFKSELRQRNLQLLKGGRFWHVFGISDSGIISSDLGSSGPTGCGLTSPGVLNDGLLNKGVAIQKLVDLYHEYGTRDCTTIALGDSPNDIDMLDTADIAIVIRHKDGTYLDYGVEDHPKKRVLLSHQPGPAGWNETLSAVLAHLSSNLSE